ncbi:MAG: nucleotidyl transferase AbiEii/AbiGii toxin family protein, partial [Bacteroidetes bacterium]|nr:nucleotidyl transferase AbiEii/AbiGii toxin family protein [Bacteroidota bacterium]
MLTNSDFSELLNHFARHEVRFLFVGGYAVMKYSEPRFTKDIDLWIVTDEQNAHAVYTALREFGAPLGGNEHSVHRAGRSDRG